MPRYFFHFQDGPARLTDSDGVALPDSEAAWYQGMRSVREIIDRESFAGVFQTGRRLEIQDEDGQQVWAVPFEEVISLAL
jgi:hypothetical protein